MEMNLLFYSSPDFSDNAFYLYKYLHELNNPDLKFYWIVNNIPKVQLKNTFFLNRNSDLTVLKDLDYSLISHTSSPLSYRRFNDKHKIINLSHGIGIKGKKEVSQMKDDPHYPSTLFDYIVSLGGYMSNKCVELFNNMPDQSKILPLGYPRNDILKPSTQKTNKIIWMPTFKQSPNKNYSEEYLDNETGIALFNSKNDLIDIDNFLQKIGLEIHLKLHRLQKELDIFEWIFNNCENLKIVGKYEGDFYQYLENYDALITDYSSINMDWLLTDKPIGYIFTDLNEYQSSRGDFCCDPIKYSAGHHIFNMLQFKAFLIDIKSSRDIYKPQREFVKSEFFKYPDNNSAKRIAEFLNV